MTKHFLGFFVIFVLGQHRCYHLTARNRTGAVTLGAVGSSLHISIYNRLYALGDGAFYTRFCAVGGRENSLEKARHGFCFCVFCCWGFVYDA